MLIFLAGLPRVGKTTFGKQASLVLSIPFVDLDQEIMKEHGVSCSELYKKNPTEFRRFEEECLDFIATRYAQALIALGGGALLSKKNQTLVKKGVTVMLTVDPEILRHRLLKNPPVFMLDDFDNEFAKLLHERTSFFKGLTDHQFDVTYGYEDALTFIRKALHGEQ